MATPENTKLCDFTSTNNNDFICTPIAPPAPEAAFYEIKPALLNLVMKEQFSGVSTEDAASMKYLVKNCPTHGLTTWMINQTFYAGLIFSSRNLLDSAARSTLCILRWEKKQRSLII